MNPADRCRGLLLGLAAGDRNGGPLRMATRLADSLLACRRFDPDDVLARYVDWWKLEGFDTGPVAAAVLAQVASGRPVGDAARAVHQARSGQTGGCNPAHRSSVLATSATLPDAEVARAARAEAALTHLHPAAGGAAAFTACLGRRLLGGLPWDDALCSALETADAESAQAVAAAATGPGGAGGYAPETLRAAVFFVATADGFEAALARSLAFAGPANYSPVLVGALAGARWGASTISRAALEHPAARPLLERTKALADALASAWR
ncbi:MAG: ADP-ribosylglycohydrolase family protein [Polyangiaceae bacterium]|nr:ADP-ribosylglycohydrolase family protein [Polyangiaceae bacterium]